MLLFLKLKNCNFLCTSCLRQVENYQHFETFQLKFGVDGHFSLLKPGRDIKFPFNKARFESSYYILSGLLFIQENILKITCSNKYRK